MTEKLAYNVKEAAQALGIGRSMLYELIGGGALPSSKIGNRRLIFRQDLEAFVAEQRKSRTEVTR